MKVMKHLCCLTIVVPACFYFNSIACFCVKSPATASKRIFYLQTNLSSHQRPPLPCFSPCLSIALLTTVNRLLKLSALRINSPVLPQKMLDFCAWRGGGWELMIFGEIQKSNSVIYAETQNHTD